MSRSSLPEAVWETGRWVLTGYLILVLLALLFWFLKSNRPVIQRCADSLLNRIPLLGKVRKFSALERFSSVFEIFLLAGMKMDESTRAAPDRPRKAG